eukprot:CAMPEP_0177758060 /NCGR_PEP_ID=MMETSP0491_2-20121128/3985_1 /TAXON_ID=63592 /ORGANISM="Tetraselmis chuii, Strain PLY429" /LENGTH=92 /DNA_ID=CAMNT_0019273773 /DNA_START=658 /DNA_END=939 /DNA_ORIENTATION=+
MPDVDHHLLVLPVYSVGIDQLRLPSGAEQNRPSGLQCQDKGVTADLPQPTPGRDITQQWDCEKDGSHQSHWLDAGESLLESGSARHVGSPSR